MPTTWEDPDDSWEDDSWDGDEDSDGDEDEQETTVDCPHCSREIYDDTDQCPYCRMYISPADFPSGGLPKWVSATALAILAAFAAGVLWQVVSIFSD